MAEMDKQIEILKLQNENLNATLQLRHLDNNMLTMHGVALASARSCALSGLLLDF